MRGGLDGRWQGRTFAVTLGGEIERTTAEGAEGFTLGTVTGTLTRTVPGQQQHLDAALSTAGGDVAVSAVLGTRHTLQPGFTLGATAALTQRLPEQTARFAFWQARGYAAFDDDLFVNQPFPLERTTEGVLSADVSVRLAPALTLDADAALHSYNGLTIETQSVAPDPDAVETIRSLFIESDAAGDVVSSRVAVRAAHGRWRGRLFHDQRWLVYAVKPLFGGETAFERAWEAVPRHRAGVEAAVSPDAGFTLSGSLVYRSGARWPAYAALDGGNGGLYSDTVPAVWLLDAALEKALWQRRLRLSLLFRNLLNQEERYHPVGAALDLRFYLRLELVL